MKKKLLVSAGEVSGDMAGASLIKEIKSLCPDIYIFGLGGDKLKEAGADIKLDLRKQGTIGLFEILRYLPAILKTFFKMKKLLDTEKPEAVLLIDFQGFNMLLAKAAKKRGIKTIYYIPPQEWLWGTEKGVKNVAETIDLIISVFEADYKAYQKAGANVIFNGHPLLDTVKPKYSKEEAKKIFEIEDFHPVVALLPGSRTQEIENLLPVLLAGAEKIRKYLPDCKFLIPVASSIFKHEIESQVFKTNLPLKVVEGLAHEVLNVSDLAITASGTTTLEAACLGIPTIMIYKLSKITYFIAKHILKISLPYYSMPNLLANKKIIPELVQEDANAGRICSEAIKILKDPQQIEKMKSELAEVRGKLGTAGAIKKAAEAVTDFI